ncbi:hypothetical protein UXP46_23560 [Enterobacter ludwigii]|uniref:hypothetical protein n=1 Tax=Enterobacter ludwigii TaxID=299767 RepID=UPI002FD72424
MLGYLAFVALVKGKLDSNIVAGPQAEATGVSGFCPFHPVKMMDLRKRELFQAKQKSIVPARRKCNPQ